jgi:hypothetical protein
LAVLVQTAGCLANPWHVRGAIFPVQTLRYLHEQQVLSANEDAGAGGPWAVISEFRPPFRFIGSPANYHTIDAYVVLLAVAFGGVIALIVRRRWGEAFVIVVFLLMSTQMRRNIAQFAFVAAPLAIRGLSGAIPATWSLTRPLVWPRRGIVLATTVVTIVWTWSIVNGRFYYDERRSTREPGVGYSSRIFPLEAARWLSEQRISGPAVFVDFSASSNLLPWLDRRYKLLVDTNTFAYDDQWFKQIMDMSAGRLDHRTFFDRHHVNIALMHFESGTEPLIQALKNDADWAIAYVDPHAVIFLRRIPEHLAILKEHPQTSRNVDVEGWLKTAGGLRYHRALSIATMGAVPFTLEWYEPAARLYEEALRPAADSAAVWNNLGLCHGNLAHDAHLAGQEDSARRQLNDAVRCFRQVVALKPGDKEARRNLSKAEELLRSIP